ncbi:MAG TPA: hypothetical protein VI078_15335 [bacterium]
MAKTNSKSIGVGVVLAISFFAVLALIFMPVFGAGRDGKPLNGLDYADDLFNKLSKGSSYFIPKLQKNVQGWAGKPFDAAVTLDKPETAALAATLFTTAGATAGADGARLSVKGDLGAVLAAVLVDADNMYKNDGAAVSGRYGGAKEKAALKTWWQAFSAIDKEFKKTGKIEESNAISEVLKKGVETAYNYYGIPAEKVADKAVLMTAVLVFYLVYTLWWGFAIFYIFDGIGLTMTKAKVKKEA